MNSESTSGSFIAKSAGNSSIFVPTFISSPSATSASITSTEHTMSSVPQSDDGTIADHFESETSLFSSWKGSDSIHITTSSRRNIPRFSPSTDQNSHLSRFSDLVDTAESETDTGSIILTTRDVPPPTEDPATRPLPPSDDPNPLESTDKATNISTNDPSSGWSTHSVSSSTFFPSTESGEPATTSESPSSVAPPPSETVSSEWSSSPSSIESPSHVSSSPASETFVSSTSSVEELSTSLSLSSSSLVFTESSSSSVESSHVVSESSSPWSSSSENWFSSSSWQPLPSSSSVLAPSSETKTTSPRSWSSQESVSYSYSLYSTEQVQHGSTVTILETKSIAVEVTRTPSTHFTTSTITSSSSIPSNAGAGETSVAPVTPTDSPESSGLATGSKVAVGVVVPVGAIAIGAIGFFFYFKRKRQSLRNSVIFESDGSIKAADSFSRGQHHNKHNSITAHHIF